MHEKFQSAYKAKYSTETTLVRVFDDVLKELDHDNVVDLALLDLTAAFDIVNHQVLLQRLKRTFRITGQALKWICSYLSDRSTVVLVNGQFSDPSALECSVPQDSKVGPRMYNEYTFPLGKLITMMLILYHLYADDSQLQKSFNPRVKGHDIQAANHLEQCICEISKRMKNNKLRLNRDKTEFIIPARHPMRNACQLIALTYRAKQLMRHRWCAILVFSLIALLVWRNILDIYRKYVTIISIGYERSGIISLRILQNHLFTLLCSSVQPQN